MQKLYHHDYTCDEDEQVQNEHYLYMERCEQSHRAWPAGVFHICTGILSNTTAIVFGPSSRPKRHQIGLADA